jgi:hypothetical protein
MRPAVWIHRNDLSKHLVQDCSMCDTAREITNKQLKINNK